MKGCSYHRRFDRTCLACATPRNGEPWKPAEERQLVRLYAKPRRVRWCGNKKLRTHPMYYAASVLQRTPCACAQRMGEILRGQQRS